MKTVKLPEVCEILDSQRIPITKSKRVSGPYPYYGANGIQDWVSDYIFDDELVLLAEDGGHFDSDKPIAYRVSGRCWVNNHAHILKAKDNILIDYLYLSLRYYDTSGLTNGATRKKLTQKAMREMTVLLRDKSEQLEIVRLFSRIDVGLVKSKQLQEKLDELVKSRFMEMFGDPESNSKNWQIKLLGEVCNTRLGKMLDKKKQSGTKLYPYLANANVQWFYFDLDNLNMMDFDESDRAEFKLQEGDVLATEGGDVGRCAVWHCEVEECFFQKAIHRIRCHRDVLIPDYFVWAFKMKADLGLFEPYTSQSTIAHLTGKKIKQVPIQIPPLALQHEFADFVRQVDKLKFETQQSIEKLQMLYDSLAQEYFAPEGD